MKVLEGVIVVLAMLLPFVAFKTADLTTYIYWVAVTALYLVYIALTSGRWVNE